MRLVVMALLISVMVVGGAASAQTENEMIFMKQAYDLGEQLREAKLHAISLYLQTQSNGKARLAIGEGKGANARLGTVCVGMYQHWPAITVYASTMPVSVDIKGIGKRVLLGAVKTGVTAEYPTYPAENLNPKRAEDGVYLLAYDAGDGKSPATVSLLALSVGDDGLTKFDPVITVPAQLESLPSSTGEAIGKSLARVELPDATTASDTNPAWRAAVEIEFDERSPGQKTASPTPIRVYGFKLDLGICMV
jgi:hypothetical protein